MLAVLITHALRQIFRTDRGLLLHHAWLATANRAIEGGAIIGCTRVWVRGGEGAAEEK